MFKKFSVFFIIFLISISFLSTPILSEVNDSSFYFPTNYLYITSEYGYRELWGSQNFHNGTDFGAPQGSNIYAISSGFVSHVGFITGYGNTVIIEHNNGYKSLYAHLDENFLVHVGQKISTSELIAKVGPKYLSNGIQNGYTTGPHLHLTIFDSNNNTINPLSLNFKKLE